VLGEDGSPCRAIRAEGDLPKSRRLSDAEAGAVADVRRPRIGLPMPAPAIPGVEQIGEPIISDARNLMDHRQAEQAPEPDVARGSEPNCDRAVGADVQAAVGVNPMQPATHVLDPGAEAGERIGLETDVTKLDSAGPGRTGEPVALPLDACIADRAFRIVPDRQFRAHVPNFLP
jgi:hypothetical protein